MKPARIILLCVLLAIVMVIIALYVPTTLDAATDFMAIYNTDLALVNHIPIYDTPRVLEFAGQKFGVAPEKLSETVFPYPPWYALSTFFLGLFPLKAAATLWFELNLVMLFLSVWLLTDGWPGRARLAAFPLSLIFIPVLGTLSIGQRDFPVLLGTAMLIYSLRKQKVALTVLGVALLTFKPHIGALILLATLIWLIGQRSQFGRRAMVGLVIAGAFLFAVGFLADPGWLVGYPRLLLHYDDQSFIAGCTDCENLPVWISRWLFDGSLASAAWIALGLLILLIIMLYLIRSSLKQPELLLSAATLVTMVASPYLYNYDFLLLLVPFAVLFHKNDQLPRAVELLCYLLPTLAIIIFGRGGNISLTLVTIVLVALLFIRIRRSLSTGLPAAA